MPILEWAHPAGPPRYRRRRPVGRQGRRRQPRRLVAALFTHGIALPHLVDTGRPELIEEYVRPTLAGDKIGALAVTEPDGGSDVAGIRTRACDGRVNGTKTYITSGLRADFFTTAV